MDDKKHAILQQEKIALVEGLSHDLESVPDRFFILSILCGCFFWSIITLFYI